MTGIVRKSPRERRRQREKFRAIGLYAISALVLAAVVIGVIIGRGQNPPLDRLTLCPRKIPAPVYWAVIIDVTDSYNPMQQAWIRNQFRAIKDSVPRHGLLAVFRVPQNPEEALEPLVALCNPGTGEDVSPLWGNPGEIGRLWENEFQAKLDKVLNAELPGPGSRTSPIMETIQAVNIATDSLVSAVGEGARRDSQLDRKIFLFSDMLQHTNDYSHYGASPPSFEDFRATGLYRKVRTDLSGWEVTIFYARREESAAQAVQGRRHIQFWIDYVSSLNGNVVRVKWIEG